jgi:hypothetical protein
VSPLVHLGKEEKHDARRTSQVRPAHIQEVLGGPRPELLTTEYGAQTKEGRHLAREAACDRLGDRQSNVQLSPLLAAPAHPPAG